MADRNGASLNRTLSGYLLRMAIALHVASDSTR